MRISMRHQIYLAAVVLSLLTTIQSRASFIKEEGGQLTTDLPGVTITSTAPILGGSEAWIVRLDPSVWVSYLAFATPGLGDEPGKVNLLIPISFFSFRWVSDVPTANPSQPPSEIIYSFISGSGQIVPVAFEDINDTAPSGGVPDGGSSLTMLGVAVAGCAGLRKRFVR
jgi:hypothetical protein